MSGMMSEHVDMDLLLTQARQGSAAARQLKQGIAFSEEHADDERAGILNQLLKTRESAESCKALRTEAAEADTLRSDKAQDLLQRCEIEFPDNSDVIISVKNAIAVRKLKKVTKALQSTTTTQHLRKLLIYCEQELPQHKEIQTDIQTQIDTRLATHVGPLVNQLNDETLTVSVLSVLADKLAQELGSTDGLVCKATEKLEALACHHSSKQANGKSNVNIQGPTHRHAHASDHHEESHGRNSASTSRRNKRKEKKTSKLKGPTLLSIISEELSGKNDTNTQKFMITVVFLLWMAITAYTFELSLRIAPLDQMIATAGVGGEAISGEGLMGVALRGSASQSGELV